MGRGAAGARVVKAIRDVKVQCSIRGSTLGGVLTLTDGLGNPLQFGNPPVPIGLAPALTESPLHALQGNQNIPEFWAIFFRASSIRPPFDLLESNGYSSGGFTDDPAENSILVNTFCLKHDWGITINADTGTFTYHQLDSADGSTFVVSSSVVENTFGVDPAPLNWADPNVLHWANEDPDFASGQETFDQGSTRAALQAAVASVDCSKFWSGEQILIGGPILNTSGGGPFLVGFAYDRSYGTPNAYGNVPDGSLKQISGGGISATRQQLGTTNVVKPGIDIGGDFVGDISYTRAQYQVRNISGFTIECNFVEIYGGSRLAKDGQVTQVGFYRPAGSVIFHTERQIEEVPLPSIRSFPASATGLDGQQYNLTFGQTLPLIGVSLQEFLKDNPGLAPV